MKTNLVLFMLLCFLFSCKQNQEVEIISSKQMHESMQQLTDAIVHDIFSPPVASRIYAYPSIAAYECVAANNQNYESLAGKLNGLTELPKPTSEHVNYQLSAIYAFQSIGQQLVFSKDSIKAIQDSLFSSLKKGRSRKEVKASIEYGNQVADHIKTWMEKDMYHQTRSYPKFSVNYDDSTRWQPTPPDYMEGIEPHWNNIRTMVIDSAQQFKPIPPPAFSLEKNSEFYNELLEVYEVRNDFTGDQDERVQISKFWDCNPYVSTHKGHFMFATKKITPGGHWIGITKIASMKNNDGFDDAVWAYTKTSIALFDAFISCWDEKYRSSLIRPETLINKYIDDEWMPILQTPPFPEYTSGHSVISTAAAISLSSIYGDQFDFVDSTEELYGLPSRRFTSFLNASQEAAISRLYGGIHYRSAIDNGVAQGKQIGRFVVNQLHGVSKKEVSYATK